FILLKLNSDRQASTYFRKALKSNPYHVSSLFYLGLALIRDQKFTASEHFLRHAMRSTPENIWIQFGLIEVFSSSRNHKDLAICLTRLFESFPLGRIWAALNQQQPDPLSPPLDHDLITKKCQDWLLNLTLQVQDDPILR
ncbi:MAG: hypothetical protein WA151_06700, partial [Desulfatirhabdiaceae bacterium]